MGRLLRIASPSTLALALIMLVLPFLAVSCDAPGGFGRVTQGGTTSYSGVDLMVGSDPSVGNENLRPPAEAKDDNIGVQPAVVVGAIVLLAALVLELIRRHLFAAGAAAAAWVLMLLGLLGARRSLTDRVEVQLAAPLPAGKAAGDYVTIGLGFWLLSLFIAGSVGFSLLASKCEGRTANGPSRDE